MLQSQRLPGAVLDALSGPVCILDAQGLILAVNESWRRFVTSHAPTGSHLVEGANYLQACDNATGPSSAEAATVAAGIRAVLRGALPLFTLEYSCHRAEERHWFSAWVRPFKDGGNHHVLVTQEDITARKLAEEALAESYARTQAILNTAVDGIITINERGLILTINPAAERLFGYSALEITGQNVNVLMPPPYRQEHDGYLGRYLATGERKIIGIGREVVGLRRDGTTFPVELSVAEARQGDWRIFVGTVRDITERKRREEDLRTGKQELEKAVADLQSKTEEVRAMTQQLWQAAKLASVGELAASIAHELNNPLATVSLRVEAVLARTPADDPRRRGLEIIDQETQRMGNLVANLLQFARRGHEQISTVDVRDELTKAVELIHYHLRKRQIAVVQEFAPDTPIIHADRQKLRQVFLNLLTNASDAMPQGGILTIRAASKQLTPGKLGVRIEIADTGVGIPAENLQRVLEPFFTTKEEGKGTGLGLAICRRVIQEHHGKMDISSAVGSGTTVCLLLPVRNGTNTDRLRDGGSVS